LRGTIGPVPMLADLLDTERLCALIEAGFITCRPHPSEPLLVYDYTARASASATWTAETRLCRGLIADRDGRVVARPFAKFFTLPEHDRGVALDPVPVGVPFEVQEKMDGSLGILYPTASGPAISTRGTFTSNQARWATEHWRARYGGTAVAPTTTLLFEIIYPANRIIVDYHGFEGLILLAAIDTTTGADLPLPTDWHGPVVRRYDDVTSLDGLRQSAAAGDTNREGFVARFAAPAGQPSLRVKLKFSEYERLHQLVTGVSSRTVWERLSRRAGLTDLLDGVPADFAAWVRATADELQGSYAAIERRCREVLADERIDLSDRRAAAAHFAGSGANTAVLFKMLDGRAYDEIIWRAVRPPHERPFQVEPEP
jgi:hypothetical protein